jgi:hypothetical protein
MVALPRTTIKKVTHFCIYNNFIITLYYMPFTYKNKMFAVRDYAVLAAARNICVFHIFGNYKTPS